RVEVHQQILDNARNLAAHLHFHHRIQLAAGGHELGQFATGHDGGFILQRTAGRLVDEVPTQAHHTGDGGHKPGPSSTEDVCGFHRFSLKAISRPTLHYQLYRTPNEHYLYSRPGPERMGYSTHNRLPILG